MIQPEIHRYIKSQLANDLELKEWSSLIKEEIEKLQLKKFMERLKFLTVYRIIKLKVDFKTRFRGVFSRPTP